MTAIVLTASHWYFACQRQSPRKHDTVGAIVDGVGHIGGFRPVGRGTLIIESSIKWRRITGFPGEISPLVSFFAGWGIRPGDSTL